MIHAEPAAPQQHNPRLTYCSSTVSGEAAEWFLLLSPEYPGEVSYLPTWFYAVWLWKVFKCLKFEFGLHVRSGRHMRGLHFALLPSNTPPRPHTHTSLLHGKGSAISEVASVFPAMHLQQVSSLRAQTDTLKPSGGRAVQMASSGPDGRGNGDFCVTNNNQVGFSGSLQHSYFCSNCCWVGNSVWSPAGVRNWINLACAQIGSAYYWITILWT